jgi:hypothetical protein
VFVIVGLSVIVGESVMVGLSVIVGVSVTVGDGEENGKPPARPYRYKTTATPKKIRAIKIVNNPARSR